MTAKHASRKPFNLVTQLGMTLALVTFVAGAVMVVCDMVSHFTNPYASVVAYMVLPVVCGLAIALAMVGWLWRVVRRRLRGEPIGLPVLDMNTPTARRRMTVALFALPVVLAITATGGYRAYHFVESVPFCGEVCHVVMEPEHTTFHNSPHAGITCASCHVGSGFKWFVRTKIYGAIELYSLALNKFERPLSCPVENLRPANETCGECHWRQKDFGQVMRTKTRYLTDKKSSPWTMVMFMNLGGGDPEKGPVTGIHWHVNGEKVEYVSVDDERLVIPWVRVTYPDGHSTVYRTTDEEQAISDETAMAMHVREMDCTDCHNRPSHRFLSPNQAVDAAIAAGILDTSLPNLKNNVAGVLAKDYETVTEAHAAIAEKLRKKYADRPELDALVQSVQDLYSANFFPAMGANWKAYPDHIGHMTTPGCFRCHDGKHVNDKGEPIVHGCDDCHTIAAQGPTVMPGTLSAEPLEFKHPEDIEEEWKTEACDTCHTGAP